MITYNGATGFPVKSINPYHITTQSMINTRNLLFPLFSLLMSFGYQQVSPRKHNSPVFGDTGKILQALARDSNKIKI